MVIGDRYELDDFPLGQGGMGAVYRGHDKHLDRKVAVKILHLPVPDEELERRFIREARILARLEHPGAPTLYDFGAHERRLYQVMQFIAGVTVADLVSEYGPLPVPWAAAIAAQLNVPHEVVDLRPHIRPEDRVSYELTCDLYDEEESPQLADRFRQLYLKGRERYSVRCREPMPYVRVCQLCRRLVVPAYHREATRHGVRVWFLGTNEWVGLSQNPDNGRYVFSGIRRLQPPGADEPVWVVHLPFLLGARLGDTMKVLERVGWQPPDGEHVVESSANSCLLGRAAEDKATRLLGFHPDSMRLAREVTCGFLSRVEAERALSTPHPSSMSVREVVTAAGILS